MSCQLIYPDLRALWSLDDRPDVRCCVCSQPFSDSDALIRTFRIIPLSGLTLGPPEHRASSSEVLKIQDGHDLFLYNRHLKCLLSEKVEYVTVSHVWQKGISTLQNLGPRGHQNPDVRRLVWHLPTQIAQNISKALGRDVEVWHDYMSVPQVRLDHFSTSFPNNLDTPTDC